MKPNAVDTPREEDITDGELGQMMLVYGKALVCYVSSQILFFKEEYDPVEEQTSWVQYNSIDVRGNIYYIKGNIRIQVVSEDYVYFYIINKKTFEPELENVMYNYMKCTQMMFGKRVRYGITFKQNEKSFDVYQRQAMHNLKIKLHAKNLEGSKGLEILSQNSVFVTEIDRVIRYDCETYQKNGEIIVKLLPQDGREIP